MCCENLDELVAADHGEGQVLVVLLVRLGHRLVIEGELQVGE